MAKQYKEYDRDLVLDRKWTELLDSLTVGIYEIELPSYSALRSLQVVVSRFNSNAGCKFKFSTSAKYKNLMLRIEVDKR